MNKPYKHILLAIGFIAFTVTSCSQSDFFDWSESYRENRDFPYDISVFYSLLQETNGGTEILTNNFRPKLNNDLDSSNFIQFASKIQLDTQKVRVLKNYVARGNNAYLISRSAPNLVLSFLYEDFEYNYYKSTYSKEVQIVFKESQDSFGFDYKYNDEATEYGWGSFVHDEYLTDSASQPLPLATFNDSSITFFKVTFGKGSFYFHTNPLLFTNYQLQKEEAFYHAQKVFSKLNNGPIYWDKSYLYRQLDEETPDRKGASVLKLFFTHESLKWGWFVFLIAAVLFVLFRSKREQRIIPIMAVNRNESVEFAKNVGNLYFKSGTHGNIALEMYNIFLHDIRLQYQIDTNKTKEELIAALFKKSGLELERIEGLFEKFKLRFSEYGKSQELIDLYKELEHFYKNKK
ncbi:MAG: hypothetical protein JXQ87_07775 [Bacteroidia bacterium]